MLTSTPAFGLNAEAAVLRAVPYAISDSLVELVADEVEGAGHRIMFVDDEPDTLKSLQAMFRTHYDVTIADSAAEAEKKLAVLAPAEHMCLIASDQRMPDCTGVEFFTRIREHYPTTCRVLVTAYADISAVIDAINQGRIHRFVHKPFDYDDFRQVVRESVALGVLMHRFSVSARVCRTKRDAGRVDAR